MTGDVPENGRLAVWPSWCRRVIIVATRYPEVSGGARFVENFAAALKDIGVRVDIASLYPGNGQGQTTVHVLVRRERLQRGPSVRRVKGAVSRAARIPLWAYKRLNRLYTVHRTRDFFRRLDENTLVVFTHASAKLAIDAMGVNWSKIGAILIGQHHSSYESIRYEPQLRESIPRAFADVDAVTVLSAGDALRFGGLVRPPCLAIPNMTGPVRDSDVAVSRPRPRKAVALTRLSPEKRLDVMIRAFVGAIEDPNLEGWKLEIYGDGAERSNLQREIDALGASGSVELCGLADGPQSVFPFAAVNLLTSTFEGFPFSVLEAAQHGVPTISFDCSSGIHDLVTTVDGVLVEPSGSIDAFAAALRATLCDTVSLAHRGQAARHGVEEYAPSRLLPVWGAALVDARLHAITRTRRGADWGSPL